ncbi:hypothetical protein PMG11_10460 [Penicillium brasilianum]|uniref:Uncharacterized protein n=1 Tax=Penicillium brasilianum TaxID=104259 RepID=A0A0F7TZ32_PENBI|nr:hypothetical protein PMG11_10460 [Penicillium brasilianum]
MHADNDLSRALHIGPYSSPASSVHGRCFNGLFDWFNLHSNHELPSGWWRVLWRCLYLCAYFDFVAAMHNGRRLSYWVKLYSDCDLPHPSRLRRALHRDSDKPAEYFLHFGCIRCVSHRPGLHTNGDMPWTLHH